VAERQPPHRMLRSAGRTALTVLRQTKQRAKLGSMHLPLDLHPLRPRAIVLPPLGPDVQTLPGTEPPIPPIRLPASPPAPPLSEETRALRSRLAVAERRVLRLRQALERERQTRVQAAEALAHPQLLIDHLTSDLQQVNPTDTQQTRRVVSDVLAAYGFVLPHAPGPDAERTPYLPGGEELPVVPGWDRVHLQAAMAQILAQQPDIGGRRMLAVALQALARQRAITPAAAAAGAGLTSSLARHRIRLALEALCGVGIARRDGQRFTLQTPRGL
jgi:hypothetical protein